MNCPPVILLPDSPRIPKPVIHTIMGSLSRHRAWARLQTALEQRLEQAATPADRATVYQDVVDRLVRIASDEVELDRIAREIAVSPATIPFPHDGASAPIEPSMKHLREGTR